MRWPFIRRKEKEEEKSIQPTSTESRKESEDLFEPVEPEELKKEIELVEDKLKGIEEALSRISEFSDKLEEKNKELQNQTGKYRSLIAEYTTKVDQLSQRYQELSSRGKTAIERYKGNLKEVIKELEELESAKRELGEVKSKIDEIMSGLEEDWRKVRAYSAADGETIAKILTKYKSETFEVGKWEEFKELLDYKPAVLEAALRIGRDTGYEASQLLRIAAAYSLKNWDKKSGKPPAEIVEIVDLEAVKKYLIDLSNQSQEASVIISSYMEK
jgi:chromosome segregation ATPase